MQYSPLSKYPTAGTTSSTNDLAAMEKMEALLIGELKYNKKGKKSANIDDMLPNITAILGMMESTIKAAHDDSQPYIDALHAPIATCAPSNNGTLQSWQQAYSGSLAGHQKCRVQEKILKDSYESCTVQKASLKKIMGDKRKSTLR